VDQRDGTVEVTSTSAEADLNLGPAALGAMYLGAWTATTLANAGRVTGSPDALRLADVMFTGHGEPTLSQMF
jgi:predicted acetyltransferase